jgi:hypothetical protein
MNVDEMIDTLNKYLIKCNIKSIAIETTGSGVTYKGVMKIPANTFTTHADTLHLVGFIPASDNPSKLVLLTESSRTVKYEFVSDSVDMFNKLETKIIPIKAQDTCGDMNKTLLELLQLLHKIESRV